MKIELIYFDGCPNIKAARESIKSACQATGLPTDWTEWNQNDDNLPKYVQGYGSPTILVEGKDVAGEKDDCSAKSACRIYEGMTGVPSAEIIQQALKATK